MTVSFPDDYQAEHLAGKEAVFECKIKDVKEPVAAEVNDELATKFGAEDLAGLKAQIAGTFGSRIHWRRARCDETRSVGPARRAGQL